MVYISKRFTKELVDAYMRNATFHAVVTHHEIEGSSYTEMLEDAVVKLVADLDAHVESILSLDKPTDQDRKLILERYSSQRDPLLGELK